MPVTSYSTTPANNNSAPPSGAPEGMAPSAVNDVFRQIMADIAVEAQTNAVKKLNSVTGTNTITADMDPELAAYAAGMLVVLTPAATNTGAVTLSIDGLTALDVFKEDGDALIAGDLVIGVPALLMLDSGADDFCLINPQPSLTAATFNAKIISAVKTADETSNSAVAQNDDHLFVTLAAATWYAFDAFLYVDSTYSGNFTIGFTETQAHQAEDWIANSQLITGGGNSYAGTNIGGSPTVTVASSSPACISMRGYFKTHATNAPTLTLQWNTTGSNATVRTGSWIKFTKIP